MPEGFQNILEQTMNLKQKLVRTLVRPGSTVVPLMPILDQEDS